jgi:hypothetical protein
LRDGHAALAGVLRAFGNVTTAPGKCGSGMMEAPFYSALATMCGLGVPAMWCFIAFIWALNFGISAWNAYAVGRAWAETKVAGGWPRFMAWMGALMSASGFSWCYLFLLVLGGRALEWLPDNAAEVALQLGYVILIPGILLSGLMIMLDSWRRAFRNGGILNYGIAAYNTYAQVHNTLSAVNTFGSALRGVTDFFGGDRDSRSSDDDARGMLILLVVIIVALALLAGVLTTAIIIRLTAGSDPIPSLRELEDRRRVAGETRSGR